MNTFRAARQYLRANVALRNAIQAGNAQATVDALQGTATASNLFEEFSVWRSASIKTDDAWSFVWRLWYEFHAPMKGYNVQATFLATASEPEEMAANTLSAIFTELGADWIDLQATAVSDAEADDIIVVGYRDDGEDVPDAIVSVVLDLATWCREQAKEVQDGER